MSKQIYKISCGVVLVALVAGQASTALGQTVYGAPNSTAPLTGTPTLTPIPPTTPMAPTSTLQQPTFDPYSSQPNTLFSPSLLNAPAPYGSSPAPYGSVAPYGTVAPGSTQTYMPQATGTEPYPPPPYTPQPYTGFGTTAPPVMYPQGTYGTPQSGASSIYATSVKLCQNTHLSWAWLYGDSGMDLDINDMYLGSTLAFPNFLWSGQPWFVSPGFGLHLWSGPTAFGMPALPSKAYSAFIDLGWRSNPDASFGVELAGRFGAFSDFTGIDDQSWRPSGNALMRFHMSPTMTLRAGVEYINRADIKLLPALGVTWTPTPQRRWDIYFPQPKLSCYLTTLGNRETWWYVGGEYGGGAWTPVVQFDTDKDGTLDYEARTLMDINDLRAYVGLEFGPPGVTGGAKRGAFIELGYVWQREVVFVVMPSENFTAANTIMLRGGVAF